MGSFVQKMVGFTGIALTAMVLLFLPTGSATCPACSGSDCGTCTATHTSGCCGPGTDTSFMFMCTCAAGHYRVENPTTCAANCVACTAGNFLSADSNQDSACHTCGTGEYA